ncbi:hypothetical protein Droror1_Dr00018534 [Drosera rotundifolia]
MAMWLCLLIAVITIAFSIKLVNKSTKAKLPPCPQAIPIIGRFLWLTKPVHRFESILCSLNLPIITVFLGPQTAIFIKSCTLAHRALIENGTVFADRPKWLYSRQFIDSYQLTISSERYGVTWRILRRNFGETIHPSRIKSFTHVRRRVLGALLIRLESDAQVGAVQVMDHFHFAVFSLLARMCFYDDLEDDHINEIKTVHRSLLLSFKKYEILHLWRALTRILLRSWWKEYVKKRRDQVEVILPFIRARKQLKMAAKLNHVTSYVDTLSELIMQVDGNTRKLTEHEIVSLCSEFINAGTDTTATALQWIMANIVKYPNVQDKLYQEIRDVVGVEAKEVHEEDLPKLSYLRATVLEALRRHPPGQFLLPHGVTEQTKLGGHLVPKNATVNVMVAPIGRDPEVWENPMEFMPERFLGEAFDITGSKEVKMIPFGVGRRICPAYGLAMLHMEYFVANLVWKFEWKVAERDEVDLTEKTEYTVVMKRPLRAEISRRENKI